MEAASSEEDKDNGAASFRSSTTTFITSCETDPQEKYNIKETSEKLGFKQRRFYDVINVLDTLGCCPKIDNETFLWLGLGEAKSMIETIAIDRGVFNPNLTISTILPSTNCISIPRITEDFIITFLALERKFLNVIDIAKYLSRSNDRLKTTRCKLYQVSVILELAGIIKKTSNTSEFRLEDRYFISASSRICYSKDPVSIYALLNRNPPFINSIITKRRSDFDRVVKYRTEELSNKR